MHVVCLVKLTERIFFKKKHQTTTAKQSICAVISQCHAAKFQILMCLQYIFPVSATHRITLKVLQATCYGGPAVSIIECLHVKFYISLVPVHKKYTAH